MFDFIKFYVIEKLIKGYVVISGMGRIQVVLSDNTEKELRKRIPNKKGE